MIAQLDSFSIHQNQTGLTDSKLEAILNPAGNIQHGIGTPFLQGVTTPLLTVVFLCAVFCRAYSVMAGLFGHPLRMAAPCSGSSNPLNPVAQSLEPLCVGYSPLQGATA